MTDQAPTEKREIEAYFVCFHASRGVIDQIGEYPTLRSAVLAAEFEALECERQVNIHPVYVGGARGFPIARAKLRQTASGGYEIDINVDCDQQP